MNPDRWLPFFYDDGDGRGVMIRWWLPLDDPERYTSPTHEPPGDAEKSAEVQGES